MSKLSNKQRVFIEEYLACWNASEAARRAGYRTKPNVAGPRLLAKDSIQALIQQRLADKAMGADEVLARLAEQARGDIGDLLSEEGEIDLVAAKGNGTTRLIKSITSGRDGLKVELYDAQAALFKLGQHHGLFQDSTVNWNIDPSQLSDEQLQRLAAGENPRFVLASPGASGAGTETPAG